MVRRRQVRETFASGERLAGGQKLAGGGERLAGGKRKEAESLRCL